MQKVKSISDSARNITLTDQEDIAELSNWSKILEKNYAASIQNILDQGLNIRDRSKLNLLLNQAKRDTLIDRQFIDYLEILKIRLSPISDVVSLSSVDNITGSENQLVVKQLMGTVPEKDSDLKQQERSKDAYAEIEMKIIDPGAENE